MCFFATYPTANTANNKAYLVESVCGLCPEGAYPTTNSKSEIAQILQTCKYQHTLEDKCMCIDTGKKTGEITFGVIYPLTGPEASLCNGDPITEAGNLAV